MVVTSDKHGYNIDFTCSDDDIVLINAYIVICSAAKRLRNYCIESVCMFVYICPSAINLKWTNIVIYINSNEWVN